MNSVLPLGLPWVQNRSVEKVGTSFSLLPVETEGRATGFYFCDAPNLGIYHFLVASCLLFLCEANQSGIITGYEAVTSLRSNDFVR